MSTSAPSTTDAVTEPARAGGMSVFVGPAGLGVVAAAGALAAVVTWSRSAWMLLGAGRGVVPEEYYPAWAFVLVFATTIGQAAGWAAGSAIAYHVLARLGFPEGARTGKLAMSLVYVGLGALPLLVFHLAFGRPLLGLPREGLPARLATEFPDAYRLLFTLHPLIDLGVLPLGALFLALVWLGAPERSAPVRYGVALAVIATSLAVALSLGIHSILVHIRF